MRWYNLAVCDGRVPRWSPTRSTGKCTPGITADPFTSRRRMIDERDECRLTEGMRTDDRESAAAIYDG